jgi:hypothetical protein
MLLFNKLQFLSFQLYESYNKYLFISTEFAHGNPKILESMQTDWSSKSEPEVERLDTYAWVSPVVSFPKVSSQKPYTRLSPPSALHTPPISFFQILWSAQYWVRSTDHEALHYVVFSTPLLPPPPLRPKYWKGHVWMDEWWNLMKELHSA